MNDFIYFLVYKLYLVILISEKMSGHLTDCDAYCPFGISGHVKLQNGKKNYNINRIVIL